MKITGIYDPGSNVTVINSKLIRLKNREKDQHSSTLKSINGRGKTDGLITLKARILDEEKNINAFILESKDFDNDMILGLDTIKNFGLTHDENLNIKKLKENIKDNQNKEIIKKEQETEKSIQEYEVNFNEGIDTNRFAIDTDHLNSDQREEITVLINKYKQIFAKDKYDVGKVKNHEAFIDLQTEKYCYKRPYRCSVRDRIEIEKQIAELLKHNLIEESYSPFGAPVTLKKMKGKEVVYV